jgi:ribosomal protein L11 methyltransferase
VGGLISHKLIPRRVGKRIVVVPTQFKAPIIDDIIPIWIDQRQTGAYIDAEGKTTKQGRAFGSGVHPTTSLCLRALEEHLESGMVVLDLGTGTGILAIAAAKLGARHVIAFDIDEHALKVAHENLATNDVDNIVKLFHGSLDAVLKDRNPRFHLIVTNILASVHQANIQMGITDLLYPKGKIIFSGMIEPEAMTLEIALVELGCQPISRTRQRQWVALIGQKIAPGM